MKPRIILLAAAAWLSVGTLAWALDVVVTADGKISGKIAQITPTEITVDRGGVSKTIAVNEIESVTFEDEPAALRNARYSCNNGHYDEALEAIDRVNADEVERPEIKQDIEYYRALAAAKAALPSGDGERIADAGKLVFGFVRSHGESFHHFDACELLGDLLIAAGKPGPAKEFYGRVAKAPWPDYQMRAGVAMGRALLGGGKADEALPVFQGVIDTEAQGDAADRQRMAAKLGKARCLTEGKQINEAVKLAQEILEKADAEQSDLNAYAYNILGIAHRKAGRTKEALWAFLHVEVLYPSEASAHVEALQNLIPLWKELQKPERAAEAERVLKEQYGKTP